MAKKRIDRGVGERRRSGRSSYIRVFVVVLTLALCLGAAGMPVATYAAVTNASIKAKENQIAAAKKEREQMKSSLTNLQSIKKNLESKKADLNNYIEEIDRNLTVIQENIEELERQIEEKIAQIEVTTAELEEAIATQTAQYEAMKIRIKYMYEKRTNQYLELFMQAGSFAELLNKAEYVRELSAYDRRKLEEYIAWTEYVEMTKKALEEEKQTLDETKEAVLEEKAAMEQLMDDKKNELSKVKADIQSQEAAIKEYEAEIAAENATIAALEKAVAAERAALAEAQRRKYDGGLFTFPCPGYTRISDNYGMRMHPTLHVEKMHNGIDLAAPVGTAVLAAYNGKVVAAAYEGSMGNYIMIDHGSGLYTLYMHCSKLYVSTGTEVSKGQKIAAVGSTGRSTGPHLHFGVRLNGEYVSPWKYMK